MLKTTTSKNLNGTSIVDDGEMKGVIVASMYASISEDGNININKTITNKEVYNRHKEEVQKDLRDFENFVYSETGEVTANE